jgi:hypothetical protein
MLDGFVERSIKLVVDFLVLSGLSETEDGEGECPNQQNEDRDNTFDGYCTLLVFVWHLHRLHCYH